MLEEVRSTEGKRGIEREAAELLDVCERASSGPRLESEIRLMRREPACGLHSLHPSKFAGGERYVFASS